MSSTHSGSTHCREFGRSTQQHERSAAAGLGLPSIEPGMPAPAGSGLTRRAMLMRSAGLALTVYGGSALAPRGVTDTATATASVGPDGRILVSIYLAGGLDGLSVLAPVNDADYRRLRPNIKQAVSTDPLDVFSEDPRLQWHPSAAALRTLHLEGKVSVLPAVGYTNGNGSHFTSRHFWEVGETNPRNLTGWMGRFLDAHGTADNPLQGLTIGYSLLPSLATASKPVSTLSDPSLYNFWTEHVGDNAMIDRGVATLGTLGGLGSRADKELAAAQRAAQQTAALKTVLQPVQGTKASPSVTYPSTGHPFPARLASLADLIDRGMPLRCVALQSAGGYDVHNDHNGVMGGVFKRDMDSIYAFQRDLESRGLADRVVTQVWSEFGRRVLENGPNGTDHGTGGISFVIGTRVRGRMVGEYPGLATLDPGQNMRSNSDYRGVYSSLLEQWFGVDAAPIIPNAASFARPELIAA